jgi:hypothetical protein
MFEQLENRFNPARDPDGGNTPEGSVFFLSPTQILGLIEDGWARRSLRWNGYSMQGDHRLQRRGSANAMMRRGIDADSFELFQDGAKRATNNRNDPRQPYDDHPLEEAVWWDHLMFAYLCESTRMYEVFARLITEVYNGRRRDVLPPASQQWLRTAEVLFYSHPLPYSVFNVTSNLRPDIRATRATDYARMFGMPVTHSTFDGAPFPRPYATDGNVDFVATLEDFLREVWRGYRNRRNRSGPSDLDPASIANLARRLFDMLTTVRRYGVLDQREFVHVTTFSYLYLTLQADYPIVQDLRAQASSPAERLVNLANMVGVQPHRHAEQFLNLAEDLPTLLRLIESGVLNNPANVPVLYVSGPVQEAVLRILTQWTMATGHDLKSHDTVITTLRNRVPVQTAVPAPLGPRLPLSPPVATRM